MSKTIASKKKITVSSTVMIFLGLFVFYLIANRFRN